MIIKIQWSVTADNHKVIRINNHTCECGPSCVSLPRHSMSGFSVLDSIPKIVCPFHESINLSAIVAGFCQQSFLWLSLFRSQGNHPQLPFRLPLFIIQAAHFISWLFLILALIGSSQRCFCGAKGVSLLFGLSFFFLKLVAENNCYNSQLAKSAVLRGGSFQRLIL